MKSILTDGTIDAAFTYFHQDRLNNVYMVSDEAGKAAEYYDYTAYGVRTIRSAQGSYSVRSNLGTAFGYQGQRHDQETGLVHMRVRVYKPDWGRFLSPDPIGLLGGSNLFAFVESAPLKYTDPFGLSPQSPQSSRSSANWFWSAVGSVSAGHTGYAMRPPGDSGFGLVSGSSIQAMQGGVGRVGVYAAGATTVAFGTVMAGTAAVAVAAPVVATAAAPVVAVGTAVATTARIYGGRSRPMRNASIITVPCVLVVAVLLASNGLVSGGRRAAPGAHQRKSRAARVY